MRGGGWGLSTQRWPLPDCPWVGRSPISTIHQEHHEPQEAFAVYCKNNKSCFFIYLLDSAFHQMKPSLGYSVSDIPGSTSKWVWCSTWLLCHNALLFHSPSILKENRKGRKQERIRMHIELMSGSKVKSFRSLTAIGEFRVIAKPK